MAQQTGLLLGTGILPASVSPQSGTIGGGGVMSVTPTLALRQGGTIDGGAAMQATQDLALLVTSAAMAGGAAMPTTLLRVFQASPTMAGGGALQVTALSVLQVSATMAGGMASFVATYYYSRGGGAMSVVGSLVLQSFIMQGGAATQVASALVVQRVAAIAGGGAMPTAPTFALIQVNMSMAGGAALQATPLLAVNGAGIAAGGGSLASSTTLLTLQMNGTVQGGAAMPLTARLVTQHAATIAGGAATQVAGGIALTAVAIAGGAAMPLTSTLAVNQSGTAVGGGRMPINGSVGTLATIEGGGSMVVQLYLPESGTVAGGMAGMLVYQLVVEPFLISAGGAAAIAYTYVEDIVFTLPVRGKIFTLPPLESRQMQAPSPGYPSVIGMQEYQTFSIDFLNWLQGSQLSSVQSVTITTKSPGVADSTSTTTSPSQLPNGVLQTYGIQGTRCVFALQGCVLGSTYIVQAVVLDSAGQKHQGIAFPIECVA